MTAYRSGYTRVVVVPELTEGSLNHRGHQRSLALGNPRHAFLNADLDRRRAVGHEAIHRPAADPNPDMQLRLPRPRFRDHLALLSATGPSERPLMANHDRGKQRLLVKLGDPLRGVTNLRGDNRDALKDCLVRMNLNWSTHRDRLAACKLNHAGELGLW